MGVTPHKPEPKSNLLNLKKHNYPGKLIVLEGTDGVGRSTQTQLLQNWLAIEGYGVLVTGWKTSELISRVIDKAKSKNALNTITFSLLYATDLADRLHGIIEPALKAGLIVVADRYIYTALARDVVRGADPNWVRKLYEYAIEPDLVVYLKMSLKPLLKRIITTRGSLDFYESGRDIGMSTDLYQSFELYQAQIMHEYEQMVQEFNFVTVEADHDTDDVQQKLRHSVRILLANEINT